MPSFQTVFRAAVMAAVVAVVVKGWHLYGPTNEQVKAAVAQATDVGRSILQRWKQEPKAVVQDPRLAAPQVQRPTPPAAPPNIASAAAPQLLPLAQAEASKLLSEGQTASPTPPTVATNDSANQAALPPQAAAKDRMPELMSRLQQLGAADSKLAPWGDGGHLYRFTCRAPLANAPMMTQHFESIAADPAQAVEQVVAKLEAWQVAQREGGTLRN